MLLNISLIVVKYLPPNIISSFFLHEGIDLDVVFVYDAFNYKMDCATFNNIFSQFRGIMIVGMYLTDDCEIIVPIVDSRIRRIEYRYGGVDLSRLNKYINLRHVYIRTSVLICGVEVISNMVKLRKFILFTDNVFALEPLVRRMPNLRRLFLPLGRVVDGYNVVKFRKLESICINYYRSKCDSDFSDMMSKIKRLKYIIVIGMTCDLIPNLMKCHRLKTMRFIMCNKLVVVDNLHLVKKLHYVEFRSCDNLTLVNNLDKCNKSLRVEYVDCENMVRNRD